MIRFDSVSKVYSGSTPAVDDLSLVAPSGQITVFVGPSGCGKTTSLRMINRMISPTSGRIWIDDRDTSKGSPAKLRRGIGYVIQHAGLFPHRTIIDNIATVPFLLGTKKKDGRQRALELMERVGLDPAFADRYPAQLSGGQQQRVGVARALAADPPVMLMDEPFSAVDPVVREQLQNEFLRLQSELGKTIVFVTHDIDEAIKLGDQVAVLRVGGTLAQMATPAELLSRPADPFVAGFVGRDRGYRALGFTPAGSLPLDEAAAVRLGAPLSDARGRTADGWTLTVDKDNRPQGWLAAGGGDTADDYTSITPAMLNLGGTLAGEGGTLREALDAALSSPSGHGVVIDSDGRLRGTITADRVLAQIVQQTGGPARAAQDEVLQRNTNSASAGSSTGNATGASSNGASSTGASSTGAATATRPDTAPKTAPSATSEATR